MFFTPVAIHPLHHEIVKDKLTWGLSFEGLEQTGNKSRGGVAWWVGTQKAETRCTGILRRLKPNGVYRVAAVVFRGVARGGGGLFRHPTKPFKGFTPAYC
jgi:hypothetical protein